MLSCFCFVIIKNDRYIVLGSRDNSGGGHGDICPIFSKMAHQNSQISSIFYVLAHNLSLRFLKSCQNGP